MEAEASDPRTSRRLPSSVSRLSQEHARANARQLDGEPPLELRDRGLDRFFPRGVEQGQREAVTRQLERNDLPGQRLANDPRPARLDPEESPLAGRHPAYDAVGRCLER